MSRFFLITDTYSDNSQRRIKSRAEGTQSTFRTRSGKNHERRSSADDLRQRISQMSIVIVCDKVRPNQSLAGDLHKSWETIRGIAIEGLVSRTFRLKASGFGFG